MRSNDTKNPASNVYSDPRMKRAQELQAQSGTPAEDLGFEHCS